MNANVYIWQDNDWPHFRWNESEIVYRLAEVRNHQGLLLGRISTLGFEVQSSAMLEAMTSDVASSSEIEGVALNNKEVRSSVAKHLGLPTEGLPEADHYVDGVVQVLVDAVKNAMQPLSKERMFNWHAALFPTGRSGAWKIVVADWRKSLEPMQVVSGAMGKEKVHYEAPPMVDVPAMMDELIDWINSSVIIDPILKAAIAHLWFVSIHPFEDGNGRIARTVTDMLMTRADNLSQRYYSISAAILNNKKEYYDILEKTQHGGMDITVWLIWFIDITDKAIAKTNGIISSAVSKSEFWNKHSSDTLNGREIKIINRLLDGFSGKLTTNKYAKICHCSTDTALRDLQELITYSIMIKAGEGRGTYYEMAEEK
jgi:Fic family protein